MEPTRIQNKTRSKSNITSEKKNRPSNKTIFFRHLLPGEENRRMLLERTYFSKSKLLYIPREVRYITSRPFVTGGRAARAGRPCFGTINANGNAPRVVTVCQVVHSAVLKTQRDSGGLFLTLRVLRGCDAPLRKPPWPTCVKAYGNVRGMIKAPTVFLRRLQRSRVLLTRHRPVLRFTLR